MSRTPVLAAAAAASAFLCGAAPAAPEAAQRLPPIPPAEYSAEQEQAATAFAAARHQPVFGPFEPLLYSPQLMTAARAMGDYLRFRPSIGTTLSELAILLTARHWSQDYEWSVHYPLALKAGIPAAVADAIGAGRRPEAMSEDQAIVYDFTGELQREQRVSDATYARAEQRFGRQGVVDLAGLCGYYTLLAMELNLAQYPVPPGSALLPHLPR